MPCHASDFTSARSSWRLAPRVFLAGLWLLLYSLGMHGMGWWGSVRAPMEGPFLGAEMPNVLLVGTLRICHGEAVVPAGGVGLVGWSLLGGHVFLDGVSWIP